MNICILGWYGTETIGDRAILDGILQLYGKLCDDINCRIGSLYPFFTERSLLLDADIYKNNAKNVIIGCFDVKNKRELESEIELSDYVIMGGGPLMDLIELFNVEYGFRYAKKANKKTILFGCGLGPLHNKTYIKAVEKICTYSDFIVYRDALSEELSYELFGNAFENKTCSICDPAVFSVLKYKQTMKEQKKNSDYVAVNFRKILSPEQEKLTMKLFEEIISQAQKQYRKVIMVPMHTFSIGGDDRTAFAMLKQTPGFEDIEIVYSHLNIHDTYAIFASSQACLGMRYHSIVFQTLLSGNNIVLDYTEKNIGKISGFLDQIDKNGFYSNERILNTKTPDLVSPDMVSRCFSRLKSGGIFSYDDDIYNRDFNQYIELLKYETRKTD